MVETIEVKRDETTSEKPVEENSALSKPEGLPEKFNSVEDLAKSYAELEAKLGTNKEQPVKENTPVQETQKGELDIAENVVENAGLDMNSLADEYAENGKLNDESYQALEKSGIPKEYVDQFIEGQKAIGEQQTNTVKNMVGGDEAYNEMAKWAAGNMSEGEKKAYNTAVNSKDMDTVKLAVDGLRAKYESANGSEPNLTQGKATPTTEQGYKSWAEVTAAMSDSRYAKDPAYQAMVKNKIANSEL